MGEGARRAGLILGGASPAYDPFLCFAKERKSKESDPRTPAGPPPAAIAVVLRFSKTRAATEWRVGCAAASRGGKGPGFCVMLSGLLWGPKPVGRCGPCREQTWRRVACFLSLMFTCSALRLMGDVASHSLILSNLLPPGESLPRLVTLALAAVSRCLSDCIFVRLPLGVGVVLVFVWTRHDPCFPAIFPLPHASHAA